MLFLKDPHLRLDMKTKTLRKNKVNVVTMGCSKNLYDSEVMMAQLKANQFEVEHESKINDAAIVIINTCGFIENAKEESINTIIDFVDAKKNGLVEKVYVSGCLSERYKDQLEEEIPEVDVGILNCVFLACCLQSLTSPRASEGRAPNFLDKSISACSLEIAILTKSSKSFA